MSVGLIASSRLVVMMSEIPSGEVSSTPAASRSKLSIMSLEAFLESIFNGYVAAIDRDGV